MTDSSGNPALWARLLAGRVTEVYALSFRGLNADLPQTLGLEVIAYDAYLYDSRGVARSPEERERLAGQLAAEPRWLAVGGPRYWVEHFARRAEAILVLMPGDIMSLDIAMDNSINAALGSVGRFFRSRAARRRPEFLAEPFRPIKEVTGDRPLTDAERKRYFTQMRNFLVDEFPDKTLVLSGDEVGLLRTVRALRDR